MSKKLSQKELKKYKKLAEEFVREFGDEFGLSMSDEEWNELMEDAMETCGVK